MSFKFLAKSKIFSKVYSVIIHLRDKILIFKHGNYITKSKNYIKTTYIMPLNLPKLII